MNEHDLRQILSTKIKVVRTEFDYTQEQMSDILGISKKTLLQIEKGRIEANWPVIVTFASIFRDSSIIQQELGENDVIYLLQTIRRKHIAYNHNRVSHHTWWKTIEERNGYILQQNRVSLYFRIVDQMGLRLFSSFYKKAAERHFNQIVEEK
ncbi:helix-turn-helix transcriptional regulator [Tenuibacillus multivorans]|uniref:DNA-binding transcriptional regulator, XRE-family HTH domain n=1 Tax=Tenuibacillus multivorans TaxID=237069 RepID=A0A1H0CX99_9BACI|nr:helix-turn-helix domain-containing protein [Tenuibacillus multivorans]GEL76128.1 transcriptional regulator [Tenuibacillus multivorans]SDN62543.1 DNA-binding transcriptional regulator, XRE-family HTH domain [Tenuibacillus multivorans]